MKVFNFHLMPYRHIDLDAIGRNGSAWVTLSNAHYDPQLGAELYHDYLDQPRDTEHAGKHCACQDADAVAGDAVHGRAQRLPPTRRGILFVQPR